MPLQDAELANLLDGVDGVRAGVGEADHVGARSLRLQQVGREIRRPERMAHAAEHRSASFLDRLARVALQRLAERIFEGDEIPALAARFRDRTADRVTQRPGVEVPLDGRFFLQNLPVMSDVAVEDASVVRFFSSSSWLTARPTAELGRSTIAVTPSWSTHFRAMRPPMSGLF